MLQECSGAIGLGTIEVERQVHRASILLMKSVIREGTLADVGRLARLRAAVWGTEQYWHDRIGGYMRGELHSQQAGRTLSASSRDISRDASVATESWNGWMWSRNVAEPESPVSYGERSRHGSRAVRRDAFASMWIHRTRRRGRSIASTERRT